MSHDDATRSVPAAALRRLVLARNGLLRWSRGRGPHGEGGPWRDGLGGEEGTLQAIRRLEAVQLDPVAVVERNHHLVLRNRVASYRPEHLEALYRQRRVFEYEANARCVLPMEDYGTFEPMRVHLRFLQPPFSPELQAAAEYVRERLAAEGPLPARSLESGDRVKGYWDAAPKTKATSQALEHLWEAGEVVVALRQGDERHFALSELWLDRPGGTGSWEPLLHKYLRAYGVADTGDFRFGWRKWPAAERKAAVERLVRQGELERFRIDGARRTYYVLSEFVPLLEALAGATVAPDVYLLPPLDNVLWRRERVADLFGFDYTWEIYLPPARRRFGPYAMPVLEGDRFIGRLDARMDRSDRVLRVERLTLEPGVEPSPKQMAKVWAGIEGLAGDVGATRVDRRATQGAPQPQG
ncbi:winged helix-turn-helix domain-containing protein [Limnochorda pilosa]|uniref:Winged helix-turn-helix domain-containing protein n=1 Tax=Limnochorda pilosa TaxID=1555112 RepID=A0A0K2SHK3_LIMPI|nr:crosslink repair DNA glycosylase YcaQ family protein [Limnochorda pilosa]BAS26304.1 hypothetical protein LIP_0447 [Limnochorda pilosa]